VEELLLRGGLPGNELDVVHHENVHVAKLLTQRVAGLPLDGVDHFVGEPLAGDVQQLRTRVLAQNIVTDGVHQVGLAKPHAAVEEQRVVRVRRQFRDREARRVGEPVGRADDERVKRILRVQRVARVLAGLRHLHLAAHLAERDGHGAAVSLAQRRLEQRAVALF